MKWTSLQLNMLPIVAIEIEQRIQMFEGLTEKVIIEGQPNDIEQLNKLRKGLKRRIEQLDRFYERYSQDETIHLFQMLKLKLERAIFKKQHIDNETMELSLMKEKESLLVDPHSKFSFGEHMSFSDYQPLFAIQKQPIVIKQNNSGVELPKQPVTPHKSFPSKPKPKVVEKKPVPSIKQPKKNPSKSQVQSKAALTATKSKPTMKVSQSASLHQNYTKKEPIKQTIKQPRNIISSKSTSEHHPLYSKSTYQKKDIPQHKPSQQKPHKQPKSIYKPNYSKKLKTQSRQPQPITQQQEQNELRFTIKMTKQQYHQLLMIKQQMKARQLT